MDEEVDPQGQIEIAALLGDLRILRERPCGITSLPTLRIGSATTRDGRGLTVRRDLSREYFLALRVPRK